MKSALTAMQLRNFYLNEQIRSPWGTDSTFSYLYIQRVERSVRIAHRYWRRLIAMLVQGRWKSWRLIWELGTVVSGELERDVVLAETKIARDFE